MSKLLLILPILLISLGCQTIKKFKDKNTKDGSSCAESLMQVENKTDIGSLNLIKKMYYRGCALETLKAIEYARQKFRDSQISVTRDTMEVVAFEGTFTDYVMESYERTYLSILAVRTYMDMGKTEDAKAELRRAYQESVAMIDTRGQDRINLFLMAVLWERLGERESSLPLYRRILEISGSRWDKLYDLATTGIEKANAFEKLKIYELGSMPDLNLNFSGKPEFRYPPYETLTDKKEKKIDYTRNMIRNCEDTFGKTITTAEWLTFISDRVLALDSSKYKVKKMARLPLVLLYATTVAVAGTYLTVMMAKSDTDGRGTLAMAGLTIMATQSTMNAGLAPDMRYWDELPQAFYLTEIDDGLHNSPCLSDFRDEEWFTSERLL